MQYNVVQCSTEQYAGALIQGDKTRIKYGGSKLGVSKGRRCGLMRSEGKVKWHMEVVSGLQCLMEAWLMRIGRGVEGRERLKDAVEE